MHTQIETPWFPSEKKEVMERLRRVETRLTKYMEAQGFDTQTKKPVWMGVGVIEVPTDGVTLRAVKEIVPADWPPEDEITVRCNGRFVIAFYHKP